MKNDGSTALFALALLLFPYAALCQPTPTEMFLGTLSGAAVNPPTVSAGTGPVELIYDPFAHTLSMDLSFSNISAMVTSAHIHCCVTPPTNVGVATSFPSFPTGVTSGSFQQVLDLTNPATYSAAFITNHGGGTAAGAEAALVHALRRGNAYTDIHSIIYPAGEIRVYLNWEMFRDGFE